MPEFRLPAWLMAPLAAFWAALVSFVAVAIPALAMWMATAPLGTPWSDALRQAAGWWLVGHAVPLWMDGAWLTLLPWGTLVIPALLLGYAGWWAARIGRVTSLRSWLGMGVCAGLCYGVLAASIAEWASGSTVQYAGPRAAVLCTILGTLAVLFGAWRHPSVHRLVQEQVPLALRTAGWAGVTGLIALLSFGALLVLASWLVGLDRALLAWNAVAPDAGGTAAMVTVLLGYLPVAATWALAYALGPGFVVDGGTAVSAFTPLVSTNLPALPLVAAIPERSGAWAWLLPIAAVLAGLAMGAVVVRRGIRPLGARMIVVILGCLGTSIGVLACAALSQGSLGTMRLVGLGPEPLPIALLAFVLTALGGALAVLIEPAAEAIPSQIMRQRTTQHRVPADRRLTGVRTGSARPVPLATVHTIRTR